jgi:hypothetical protein
VRRPGPAALALLVACGLASPRAGQARETAGTAGAPGAAVKRFALVIGNNGSRSGLPPLRYADDDAVRWAIVLDTFGADVELLTDLDAESRTLYGAEAPPRHTPSGAEIDAAMARLREGMLRARASAARVVFYFVYAGHGDVDGAREEGYLAIADGQFFRHDLEERILAASPADTNHVIIDACRATLMAFDRGPGGSRRPWQQPYFDAGTAARFRNTGFVLASSSGGAAHEWEEFQAGIFSHEVRSGLLGAADADGDGRITYAELGAFVRVANESVRNERFRPRVLAQPPALGNDVLVAVADARGGLLRLGRGRRGRHVLEDALGVRWVDMHPGPGQAWTLALPAQRWGGDAFFLRALASGVEYPLARAREIEAADRPSRPSAILQRGALHEAFSQLFALPFDAASVWRADDGAGGEAAPALAARPSGPRPEPSSGPAALLVAEGGASGALAREVPALLAARLELRSGSRHPAALALDVASGAGAGLRETYVGLGAGLWRGARVGPLDLLAGLEAGPGIVTQSAPSRSWSPALSLSPALGGALWLTRRVAVSVEARLAATLLRIDDRVGFWFRPTACTGLAFAL